MSSNYIELLKKSIITEISKSINEDTLDEVVKKDLFASHILEKNSAKFQKYYFNILENEILFLSSKDYFKEFKQKYSLQGIDNSFLENIEMEKKSILALIKEKDFSKLYFSYFKEAEIKYGEIVKKKELGSFFAKLVHTFLPKEYCALDSPIKKYLGLKNESFFVSFICISESYKTWAETNKPLITEIRKEFQNTDKDQIVRHDRITDLKLLDLIFWSKANRN